MKQANIDAVPSEPAGNEHFSGSVSMKSLATVDTPRGSALLVTFEAGAAPTGTRIRTDSSCM